MRDFFATLRKTAASGCASFANGRTGGPPPAPLPPEARLASARTMAARLDLARAGLDHPTPRDLSSPPEEAMRQLKAQMRRRDPVMGSKLDDRIMVQVLNHWQRCDLAVLYYSAIEDLPPETGAIVLAYDFSAGSSLD